MLQPRSEDIKNAIPWSHEIALKQKAATMRSPPFVHEGGYEPGHAICMPLVKVGNRTYQVEQIGALKLTYRCGTVPDWSS